MENKLYIEKVKLDSDGNFISSNLIVPTIEQINEFKSNKCNHDLRVDKLIYDVMGSPYDLRFCAVCNTCIGAI